MNMNNHHFEAEVQNLTFKAGRFYWKRITDSYAKLTSYPSDSDLGVSLRQDGEKIIADVTGRNEIWETTYPSKNKAELRFSAIAGIATC